jgi:YD repeat-containing protein
MRCYLGTMVLCFVSATAFAQAIGNAENAAGQPGDAAGGRNANGASNTLFAAIDADGDGIISTKELRNAIKVLKGFDADKDGNITRAEASVAAVPSGAVAPGGLPAEAAQAVDEVMKNDKNGDGKLTTNELPREMVRNLQDVDANADGSLTRDELMAAAQRMQNQLQGGLAGGLNGPWGAGSGAGRQDATGEFMRYDRNGDGRLSADEVPPQMKNMLQGGDKNNDGMIDARELQEIIARMGNRARAAGAGVGAPGDGGQGGVNRPGRNPPRN